MKDAGVRGLPHTVSDYFHDLTEAVKTLELKGRLYDRFSEESNS